MHTENDREQHSKLRNHMLIGTIIGLAETILLHPLWILKARNQCNYPFTLKPSILYKGATFSAITSVTTSIFQVSSTILMSEKIDGSYDSRFRQQAITISAFTSGIALGFLCTPVDIILVQQQKAANLTTGKSDNGFFSVTNKVVTSSGIRGLFRGAPITAFQCAMYNYGVFVATPWIGSKIAPKLENNTSSSLIGGLLSGTLLTLITHPSDTIVRLQQDQTMQKMRLTAFELAKKLYAENGAKGFYRGLGWRTIQNTISIASSGTILETMRPTF